MLVQSFLFPKIPCTQTTGDRVWLSVFSGTCPLGRNSLNARDSLLEKLKHNKSYHFCERIMYGIALSDNIAQRLIKYLKGEFRFLYKVLINKDTDMVIIGMIPVSDMGGEYYVSVKCPPVLGFFSIVSRAPPAAIES